MPSIRLARRVQGQHVSAWFAGGERLPREHSPDRQLLGLPDYRQLDDHSCAFVAALTVLHHFEPEVPAGDVLTAVRPSLESGCDQPRLVRALRQFGVQTEDLSGLTGEDLFQLTGEGTPVIVTVWLAEYGCDHWAVLRGVDLRLSRAYLMNHDHSHPERGLAWAEFEAVWYPRGTGLVCARP